MSLPKKVVLEFLRIKNAFKSCRSCGNDARDIHYSLGDINAWNPNCYKTDESNTQLVITECNNCANMQLFSGDTIRDVMQQSRHGGEDVKITYDWEEIEDD